MLKQVGLGLLMSIGLSGMAQAATVNNAANLSSALRRAKATVDRAIASANSHGRHFLEAEVQLDDDLESDSFALPIYMQSGTTLNNAASFADNAKFAFLSGNIAFGNFQFAQACVNMGIARSQVARANSAALQPPVGFLAAFGPELNAVVNELTSLRFSEGCP